MDSRLEVQSVQNQGSRFWFDLHLPSAKVANRVAETRDIRGYVGPRLRVLVVDDEADGRQFLSDALSRIGFEVAQARDGQEGLEMARDLRPALILTDIKMPAMSGVQMVSAVRVLPELAATVIIATSASVFAIDRNHCFDAGCQFFLEKPLMLPEVFETIRTALKLEWHFSDSNLPRTSLQTALVLPETAVLDQLLAWARAGKLLRIKETLNRLVQEQPILKPFADSALSFVQNYQDRELLVFLEQCHEQ